MIQLELKPASHTHDPVTSKVAEGKVNRGQRQTNTECVYGFVWNYPNKTASEYVELIRNDICFSGVTSVFWFCHDWSDDKLLIEVRRRLSDMNGTLVEQGPKRRGRLNNDEVTWKAK